MIKIVGCKIFRSDPVFPGRSDSDPLNFRPEKEATKKVIFFIGKATKRGGAWGKGLVTKKKELCLSSI